MTRGTGRWRWVLGAMGPTIRTASISPGVDDPAARSTTLDAKCGTLGRSPSASTVPSAPRTCGAAHGRSRGRVRGIRARRPDVAVGPGLDEQARALVADANRLLDEVVAQDWLTRPRRGGALARPQSRLPPGGATRAPRPSPISRLRR